MYDEPEKAHHLVAFTTFELEAIGYCGVMQWDKSPGLTGPEKQAVQRVQKKLREANLRAQVMKATAGGE